MKFNWEYEMFWLKDRKTITLVDKIGWGKCLKKERVEVMIMKKALYAP